MQIQFKSKQSLYFRDKLDTGELFVIQSYSAKKVTLDLVHKKL